MNKRRVGLTRAILGFVKAYFRCSSHAGVSIESAVVNACRRMRKGYPSVVWLVSSLAVLNSLRIVASTVCVSHLAVDGHTSSG